MASLNFDANQVEPNASYEVLPAGKYSVVITESEMKPTKAGTGRYLELRLQVIEGPHEGRLLFDRLNLENPNEKAVQIARGTLSAICRAVGIMKLTDSGQLHDTPIVATVKVVERQDNGEPSNEVKGYAKYSEGSVNSTPDPVAKKNTPPWKK
jgi:hypothetical protein